MTPKSYDKVIAGPQAKEWYIVSKSEYNSQVMQSMFTIIILFYDHKTIKKKWMFKLKENLNSSIERYKVRWVTKRY